jgi:hypothetical protein
LWSWLYCLAFATLGDDPVPRLVAFVSIGKALYVVYVRVPYVEILSPD